MTCSVWPTTCAANPTSAGDRYAVRRQHPVGITGRHTAGMGDRHAAKLQEACTGFAAVLWEEVLKSGGESLLPTKMAGAGVFQGLACQALAMHLARAGGLSDFLYRAMAASLAGGGCEKGTG